jgi:NAD(P)-dependent dehydrogenase (short-subunit alcohol dehydrogenase family)
MLTNFLFPVYNCARDLSFLGVKDMNQMDALNGKIAVVTGATSGIGLHTAMMLAGQGAIVIGAGRSRQRCDQAVEKIQASYPQAQVRYLTADISSQSQVRQLAVNILKEIQHTGKEGLDILINNAGTFSEAYVKTPEGFELTFAVNHLAPFLLTHELLPALSRSPGGRIITVSSESHQRTFLDLKRMNTPLIYNGLWAYKVSKLANVLFTLEFNRQFSVTALRAFAIDPGLVDTEIGEKGTRGIARLVWKIRRKSGVHPDIPARTILHLCGDQLPQNQHDFYWYDCKPILPSRQARREDLARKLWDISRQMCCIIEGGKENDDERKISSH